MSFSVAVFISNNLHHSDVILKEENVHSREYSASFIMCHNIVVQIDQEMPWYIGEKKRPKDLEFQ